MAIEEKAAAAGLVLQHEAGATRWAFAAGSAGPRFRMAPPAQPDDSTAASGGVIAVETGEAVPVRVVPGTGRGRLHLVEPDSLAGHFVAGG